MKTSSQTLATTLLESPERLSYNERRFLIGLTKKTTPLTSRQEAWLVLIGGRVATQTLEQAPGHSAVRRPLA